MSWIEYITGEYWSYVNIAMHWKSMMSVVGLIRNQIVRNIPLIEALVITDSIVNGVMFTREYSIYKFAEDKIKDKTEYKKEIVKKCNNIYTMNMMDRYLMYLGVQIVYTMSCQINNELVNYIIYIVMMSVAMPIVQNGITSMKRPREFLKAFNEDKEIFARYTVSKFMVNGLKMLDEGVQDIKNYNIFLVYHILSIHYFFNFAKSYLFIFAMYMLRKTEQTYYYYKAIKLAYYYNSGYLFNVMTKHEAAYIINMMIKERRWKDISEVEITHALHVIIMNKLQKDSDSIEMQLAMLRFFSIWTIIAVLKLISIELNTIILVIYVITKKNMIDLAIIVYMLTIFNTNDILIGVILLGYKPLHYLLQEVKFYIKNRKDIKKVLTVYGKKLR